MVVAVAVIDGVTPTAGFTVKVFVFSCSGSSVFVSVSDVVVSVSLLDFEVELFELFTASFAFLEYSLANSLTSRFESSVSIASVSLLWFSKFFPASIETDSIEKAFVPVIGLSNEPSSRTPLELCVCWLVLYVLILFERASLA